MLDDKTGPEEVSETSHEADIVVDADAVDEEDADLLIELTEEDLLEEINRLTTEVAGLREQYLRKLAEFDNFRKRTEREREELERTAGEDIVREFVPVLDNFERAMFHGAQTDPDAFHQGIEMIARQLWEMLQRRGLAVLDPLGEGFRPEFHDAVQRVEGSEHEPGTVTSVLAKGYLFGGKLIRPALVAVAVGPAEQAGENGVEGENGS